MDIAWKDAVRGIIGVLFLIYGWQALPRVVRQVVLGAVFLGMGLALTGRTFFGSTVPLP